MIIAVNFQFKQLEGRSLKISGLQQDLNSWPPRYQCDAWPTELWSHTLGARSICWVHVFPCSEIIWNIYEMHFVLRRYIGSSSSTLVLRRDIGTFVNKLTSFSMCSFTAQLVEYRTGIAEVTASNPVEALILFRLLPSNYLNWKIYCDDHSSLSSTTTVHMNFIYISLYLKYWKQMRLLSWIIYRERLHRGKLSVFPTFTPVAVPFPVRVSVSFPDSGFWLFHTPMYYCNTSFSQNMHWYIFLYWYVPELLLDIASVSITACNSKFILSILEFLVWAFVVYI